MTKPSPHIPKSLHTLRVLHTADWHIGKRLRQLTRYEDFEQFLNWLLDTLEDQSVDVLIVAGDIFDTMTPSNKAQQLYYSFLGKLNKTCVRHIIITAGNHDSPSFLDAPKALLGMMNIWVIGTPTENPSDSIMTLYDSANIPCAIVAGVSYLRDKDIRTVQLGESLQDKEENTRLGINNYYSKLSWSCQQKQAQILDKYQKTVPIIATGHLFTAGATRAGHDDGMRDLYIGGLGIVGVDCFDGFDYVALGHIHKAQCVGGTTHIRYCGSPMMFNFGEKGQKCVLLVDFEHNSQTPIVHPVAVPIFRQIIEIQGSLTQLQQQLKTLIETYKNSPKSIWIKVCYTDNDFVASYSDKLHAIVADTPLSILIISTPQHISPSYADHVVSQDLNDLNPQEVFAMRLCDAKIVGQDADDLMRAHHELLKLLYESDQFAQ